MDGTFRIAILGLGGVGGYLGVKLAALASSRKDLEVIFLARGENLDAIRSSGLKLISPEGEQIAHPTVATNRPDGLARPDLIICCVKSYDLESSLAPLRSWITNRSVIFPVLNGVDASERIRALFPDTEVWEGLVYILARLASPGVVRVSGSVNRLVFGSQKGSADRLKKVESLLKEAGIPARLSANITAELWEKYLYISPLATLTSYLDLPIGAIVNDPARLDTLKELLGELQRVAEAGPIPVRPDIVQFSLDKSKSFPPDSTTSMHTDFRNGRRTELDSLTGHVVDLGKRLGVPTPRYEEIFAALKSKPASHQP